ncbi:hypothetical protein CPJ18_11055 [Agrobacterium rosae]|uniref:Uncharacterized protein n=1 Tax=Agrobacterium rosae TaxID=1972867 RepID=A0AAE5RWV9_9HYPH|nr:hypothetical protein [Agrobacterium rosae]KAA3522723.1 hypothetical protein DXM25_04250 [Agrobacterium rosae]MDX8330426.1 hypothetical protein [Agrobacterium rosae]MQB47386.1 hypothetical protein [Agrobacterium rosae]POO51107.1 hypothetical protein CPJ18_11055 [Agrobacterium rosae]
MDDRRSERGPGFTVGGGASGDAVYIMDGDDSFSVSIVRSGRSLENLLDNEGPFKPEDIEDI